MNFNNFKNITLQQLESLVNVANERSFSRAARKMNLTQPSLTKHIKNLEDIVNVNVVNRKNVGVSLTPEGKVLYDYALRIFKLLDDARDRVIRLRENESGAISISASTIPATYILPLVLQAFKARYNDIHCAVQMNDSESTLDMILNEEAEIGFVGKSVENRKLHAELLWNDRLVFIVPEGHRWCRRDSVTFGEIAAEPFILRERGSATRLTIEEFISRNTGSSFADFYVVCELGSSEAVKEAIIAGSGVSIMSIHAVKRELRQGILRAVPIKDCVIERGIYLIYRRNFNMMRHHLLFLDFVKEYPVFLPPE